VTVKDQKVRVKEVYQKKHAEWCHYHVTKHCIIYPGRCKISSIGQSAGLVIPMSSFRFRQNPKKPRTQIYMDLSYIDPQARVLIIVSSNKSNHQSIKCERIAMATYKPNRLDVVTSSRATQGYATESSVSMASSA